MKCILLIVSFLICSLNLCAEEIRVLFPNPDGCSGDWILYDSDTKQITGWGSYNHCNRSTDRTTNKEQAVQYVITQGKEAAFLTKQPATGNLSVPTKEDLAQLEELAPKIQVYPNPTTSQSIQLAVDDKIKAQGTATYTIAGFDGKTYTSAQLIDLQGDLTLPTMNLPKGTYFIIITINQQTYSSNFVVK